ESRRGALRRDLGVDTILRRCGKGSLEQLPIATQVRLRGLGSSSCLQLLAEPRHQKLLYNLWRRGTPEYGIRRNSYRYHTLARAYLQGWFPSLVQIKFCARQQVVP